MRHVIRRMRVPLPLCRVDISWTIAALQMLTMQYRTRVTVIRPSRDASMYSMWMNRTSQLWLVTFFCYM